MQAMSLSRFTLFETAHPENSSMILESLILEQKLRAKKEKVDLDVVEEFFG